MDSPGVPLLFSFYASGSAAAASLTAAFVCHLIKDDKWQTIFLATWVVSMITCFCAVALMG